MASSAYNYTGLSRRLWDAMQNARNIEQSAKTNPKEATARLKIIIDQLEDLDAEASEFSELAIRIQKEVKRLKFVLKTPIFMPPPTNKNTPSEKAEQ